MATEPQTAPRATYRVQLHAGFGFDAVAGIADYLEALGVSHVYSSPYLQAAKSSMHGYDVIDPHNVNAELGGAEAHARFCQRLGACHLGQVLDVVPNHMSIADRNNRWWWDVLENGQSSRYAAYFDVEWQPPEAKLHNMVLLPLLGDHYGRVVDAGEIRLDRDGGSFVFRYHDHVVPVAPRSLDNLLASAADRCSSSWLAFIADAFGRLPLSTATDRMSIARRHRDKEVLRAELARLCLERPDVAAAIDQVVAEINVEPDALDELLERQNYRLAYWRTAGRELGYRRFFDINNLVSLRMEDEQVFADTHVLVLKWLEEGILDGLRIDHPDGLRDPQEYLRRLREAAPQAWIVVEKILAPDERLPETWPVHGTTGYDFLNRLGGLFIHPGGAEPLTRFYQEFTDEATDYAAIVREKKLLVLREMFGSDVNRLTATFVDVCEARRRYRDYTRHELHEVLREVIACFPVYRTYIGPYTAQVTEADARYVNQAVDEAKARRPELDADLFNFLRDLLLLRLRGDAEADLVARFQQLSGPAMAKGVEDTAFYVYNRLICLNEVGGDPGRFGLPLDEFHAACRDAQQHWPYAMLATSTHDTKRSEDVRARIAVLSEIPDRWRDAVARWSAMNDRHWHGHVPDRNMEYSFYQTLIGAWPLESDRALQVMEKSCREAKVRTSWTNPNAEYEQTIGGFVANVLGDEAFRADFEAFLAPLLAAGRINSLSQTVIKLTLPNVPDIYQGMELWDLSLVDPDNRRPVDYDLRRRLLGELKGLSPEQVWARADEGLPKLWVTRELLHLRKSRSEILGGESSYEPLIAAGTKAAHVIAFARGKQLITVAPRWLVKLGGDWADTKISLPAGRWTHVFSGDNFDRHVRIGEVLRRFPVAVLTRS